MKVESEKNKDEPTVDNDKENELKDEKLLMDSNQDRVDTKAEAKQESAKMETDAKMEDQEIDKEGETKQSKQQEQIAMKIKSEDGPAAAKAEKMDIDRKDAMEDITTHKTKEEVSCMPGKKA